MRQPFLSLNSGGLDLMDIWGPLIISATITDERGMTSDRLTVELDNRGGQCAYPGTGQVISATGGYADGGGTIGGDFEVNQIDFEGFPEKIVVHGTPVSAKGETKKRKTEAHKKDDTKTLGDLGSKIAKRNGWTPRIGSSLAQIPIEYEGQSGEFDMQFIERIARRYGGIAAVKQGKLVMTMAGSGESASGLALPPLLITYGVNLLEYRASVKAREKHGKAQAHFFDRKDVKRIDVDAGQGSIEYLLREPFKSRDEAKKAAEAKLSEVDRGSESATFVIEGDPTATAERPALVSGCPSRLNRLWNITRAEHRFEKSYKTTCECESKNAKDGESGGDSE